jgi:hypothetical protein
LLRNAPENRSSPRVIKENEYLKINYQLNNKTWTNQQIKNHKNCHELRLMRAQT